MNQGKHNVVIVGGSFGGVNAAYQLRRKLGDRVEITLVSAEPDFTFIPSLPWVMMGWRRPEALKVPLARPLAGKGVDFVNERATAIDPSAQTVTTASGKAFGYDHLVLATGADLDWADRARLRPRRGRRAHLLHRPSRPSPRERRSRASSPPTAGAPSSAPTPARAAAAPPTRSS